MPRVPSEEKLAEMRKAMEEMADARLARFETNATKLAETLGAFRAALQKSGFSAEESMQIVLKVLEQPNRRGMFLGAQGDHFR